MTAAAAVPAGGGVVIAGVHVRTRAIHLLSFAAVVVTAVALGFTVGGRGQDPTPWVNRLSSVIGWAYFACWGLMFYPQLYINWARQSVEGMSFDFNLLNVVGFLGYTLFNLGYYYSDAVREDYCKAYYTTGDAQCKTPGVRANDVFFAIHGLLLSGATTAQIFIYDRAGQSFSKWPIYAVGASAVGFAAWAIYLTVDGGRYPGATPMFDMAWGGANATGFAGGRAADVDALFVAAEAAGAANATASPRVVGSEMSVLRHPSTWLDFLAGLSYLKLAAVTAKYFPQIYLNHRRRCTAGYSMSGNFLNFMGGVLSITQAVMDALDKHDWFTVTGNPVKFGLGCTSVTFGSVFMVQHYGMYRGEGDVLRDPESGAAGDNGKDTPKLLASDDSCGDVEA